MIARCFTALFGGYSAAAASASAVACFVAHAFPSLRVEATGWAMILSFLIHPGLALWAFHEERLWLVAALIWGLATAGALAVIAMGPVV